MTGTEWYISGILVLLMFCCSGSALAGASLGWRFRKAIVYWTKERRCKECERLSVPRFNSDQTYYPDKESR